MWDDVWPTVWGGTFTPDVGRTYAVAAEDRTVAVAAEDRTLEVA